MSGSRDKMIHALYAVVIPALLYSIGVDAGWLRGDGVPDLLLLGQVNYMPLTGGLAAWVLWFLAHGVGEESGWRRFDLPHLKADRSAARATLVLGLIWAFWHLPPLFYLDTYQQMGLWTYPSLAFTIVCGNVIYTWIYSIKGAACS